MKNKIQKLALLIILTIFVSTNSFAGDTYAGRGAWIGAAFLGAGGATVGVIAGYELPGGDYADSGHDTPASSGEKARDAVIGGVALGVVGAGIGAGLGALVGLAFPRHPNVSIAPLLIQSKTQGNTTGGSVEFNF